MRTVHGAWPTPVNVTIPFGEWHYVAASYDGTGYKIYIDGKLEGEYERVKGGELDHSDAAVAIGRFSQICNSWESVHGLYCG